MQRICPACHEKLTTNDHYFCGSCGSVLDNTLIYNTGSTKKIIDLDKVSPAKNKIAKKKIVQVAKDVVEITNLQGILILLAVLFFVGLPTYIFLSGLHTDLLRGMALPKKKTSVSLMQQTTSSAQTSPSLKPLPLVSSNLGNPSLMAYVPYTVDIFMESGDLYNSLKLVAVNDSYYQDLLDFVTPLTSEKFVAFAEIKSSGTTWAIVTPLKNGITIDNIALPDKYKWLSLKVSERNLILSNSSDFIDLSVNVASGLEKNINMNPTFVPMRNRVATSGKLAIVALTGEGKNLLTTEISPEIPQVLTQILMPHFEGTTNYLVVRD